METVTPAGLPPEDAPAPDVTGPDITPAGLPPKNAPSSEKPGDEVTPAGLPPRHPMSAATLVLAGLAGFGLVSLVSGAGRILARRFPAPLPSGVRPAL